MPASLQPAVIPASNPDSAAQLSALLHSAGVAALDDIGWIRVTGSDRVRWLNGMVTNNIHSLQPGQGCYNFVLNAQGRILGDLTAFLLDDSILLETSRDQLPALLGHLDRFIIMDDVELADWTTNRAGLLIAGPEAESLLRAVGFAEPLDSMKTTADNGLLWRSFGWKPRPDPWPAELVEAYSPIVATFEIWSTANIIEEVRHALTAAGAVPVIPEAIEDLRILSGTPRYGTDIRNTETAHDLPQETGQTRALHFTKGCYLGQEIVERIRSRGNVHRTFSGFQLTGRLTAPGTILTAEGKSVGELTSVAAIQLSDLPTARATPGPVSLALGYIRREALPTSPQARGLTLEYPGGIATAVALPFVIS